MITLKIKVYKHMKTYESIFICISERNSIARLPYRHIENSVFFCYDINCDEADGDTEGPIDAFIIINQSGLASKSSWVAQIDEAVENETDEFWQQVTRCPHRYIAAWLFHAGTHCHINFTCLVISLQVKQKTQEMTIKRNDAILEVYTDRIVEKSKDCNQAILWVSKQDISEFFVCS